MSGSTADLVDELSKRGAEHLYIDGGKTIQSFLDANLIRGYRLTIAGCQRRKKVDNPEKASLSSPYWKGNASTMGDTSYHSTITGNSTGGVNYRSCLPIEK